MKSCFSEALKVSLHCQLWLYQEDVIPFSTDSDVGATSYIQNVIDMCMVSLLEVAQSYVCKVCIIRYSVNARQKAACHEQRTQDELPQMELSRVAQHLAPKREHQRACEVQVLCMQRVSWLCMEPSLMQRKGVTLKQSTHFAEDIARVEPRLQESNLLFRRQTLLPAAGTTCMSQLPEGSCKRPPQAQPSQDVPHIGYRDCPIEQFDKPCDSCRPLRLERQSRIDVSTRRAYCGTATAMELRCRLT